MRGAFRAVIAAATLVGALLLPASAYASHTLGCGLLGVQACPHAAAPSPAPDPGGNEGANLPIPPGGGRLVGFSDHLSAGNDPAVTPAQEYDLARVAGANAHRLEVVWAFLEPHPPAGGTRRYAGAGPEEGYVDELDRRYAAMRGRGITPVLVLSSAPLWAQPLGMLGLGPACQRDCWKGWEPRDQHISDWGQFARFIAQRYPEAVFEIWNEPNLKTAYLPTPNPGRYLRLYQTAYDAIKGVRPGAAVLAGAVSGLQDRSGRHGYSQRDFISALYGNGLKSRPDFRLSAHVYPTAADLGPGTYYAQEWDSIMDNLVAYDDRGREVWVTETGISTSPNSRQGDPRGPEGLVATPTQQRDVMRRVYNRMFTMGGANVKAVLVHTLRERTKYGTESVEYGYGFVDASPAMRAKPAFCWMVNSEPAGAPDRTYPGC
jgi:hypothetical protein